MLTISRSFLSQAIHLAASEYLKDAGVMDEQAKTLPNYTQIADQFRRQWAQSLEIAEAIENGDSIRFVE